MKENPSASQTAAFNIGVFFLLLVVLPFLAQSALFLVHIPVNPFVFPLCALLALANLVYRLQQVQVSKWALGISIATAVVLTITAPILCRQLYDFSYDGLWYHQDAVRLMQNGWNPNTHVLELDETSLCDIYLNHYPKAVWITEASYYSVFGILDMAKALNFYMVFAVFFLSLAMIKSLAHVYTWIAVVFALFIALNPVVAYQWFTFYVDGVMGSLLTCTICLMLPLVTEKGNKAHLHIYLALALLFLVNIKFTSLVYACVLMAGYVVYSFFYRVVWVKQTVFYAGVFVVGVLVLGYSTYVRNTITKGHPFYPLMGEGNVGAEIEKAGMSADLIGKNRFEQFNIATFARSEWVRAPAVSRPKPLFTIDGMTNYDGYKRADAEMSGFGPVYAEMFLMLGAGLLLLLLFGRKLFSVSVLFLLVTLLLSIVIIPSFWYARYAPQIWLFSMLLLLLLWKSTKTRWLAVIIMIFTAADIFMVTQQNIEQLLFQTETLNHTLEELKNKPERPRVHPGWMQSVKVRMDELGFKYEPVTVMLPQDSVVWIPGLEISGAYYMVKK